MSDKKKIEEIRSHFTQESKEYDQRIRKIIPRYDEMLDALISCTAPDGSRKMGAIDIGCGTGGLSEKFLAAHPEAKLTCLDMTESMLELAKKRLKGYSQVKYVLADFHDFEFNSPYDNIITSLALHHAVTDNDKVAIYKKIFGALESGGSFYNADLVIGSNERLQDLYMMRWKEHMVRGLPKEDVEHVVLHQYQKEDHPATLVDHLRWLEECGFHGVDVVWKNYNFAVYGGTK